MRLKEAWNFPADWQAAVRMRYGELKMPGIKGIGSIDLRLFVGNSQK
jgi:hypothetical protein